MGVSTYGWIEVQTEYPKAWHGVVKLTPYTFPSAQNYQMRQSLWEFAYSGFPADVSTETLEFYNAGQYMPPGWVEANKVWQIDWEYMTEDWVTFFTLMKTLSDYYTPEKVRFIFWAD